MSGYDPGCNGELPTKEQTAACDGGTCGLGGYCDDCTALAEVSRMRGIASTVLAVRPTSGMMRHALETIAGYSMNMLPNDHHPGPRCSCEACLREYPEAQPPSKERAADPAKALQWWARGDSVLADACRAGIAEIERLQRASAEKSDNYRQKVEWCERLQLEIVTLKKCLYDEQHGITAAIRSVIAEMIAVAADGDRDEADWTADNCAQIDAWQVLLADAVAGQPPPALDNEKHDAWEWLRREALEGNAHAGVAIIEWTTLKRAAQPPSDLQDLLHDISATLESAKEFSSLHDMRAAMIQVLMSIGEYSTATK